jgi:hypothetical protein
MAFTVTTLESQASWARSYSVIADDDADTALVITNALGEAANSATPLVVGLVPLSSFFFVSAWVLSTLTPMDASFTLTKLAAVGSGSPAAQLLVTVLAPGLAALAHP